jgi:hypothetical protein
VPRVGGRLHGPDDAQVEPREVDVGRLATALAVRGAAASPRNQSRLRRGPPGMALPDPGQNRSPGSSLPGFRRGVGLRMQDSHRDRYGWGAVPVLGVPAALARHDGRGALGGRIRSSERVITPAQGAIQMSPSDRAAAGAGRTKAIAAASGAPGQPTVDIAAETSTRPSGALTDFNRHPRDCAPHSAIL